MTYALDTNTISNLLIVYLEDTMKELNDEDVMNLTVDDFRDLTPQEIQQDNFRRMFQLLGLIYQNQIEIKNMLAVNKN